MVLHDFSKIIKIFFYGQEISDFGDNGAILQLVDVGVKEFTKHIETYAFDQTKTELRKNNHSEY